MPQKMRKLLLFLLVFTLFLSITPSLFAQDDGDIFSRYQLDGRDKVILTQPSVCYITMMYYGYVYDPNFEAWSVSYFYGPFGGTGFTVNPETGHIATAAHVIEADYVDIKWAILDAYIWDTYPDDYWNLTNNDWNSIYDNFKVEGANKTEPDREVWVQFNTATGNVPDNPDNTYIRAEVIDSSPWDQRDIAILKIQAMTGRALTGVMIGESARVEIQDNLTIIGYPWTGDISWESIMTPTVTSGIISAKKMVAGTEVFQIDGTAAEGNSGGPVLNSNGEVIGMLTMGTTENVNFLRPGNDIMEMLNRNGVTNKVGTVGENFAKGLALYRMGHYSESLNFFNAVLNSSQGHMQAQDYKANAQGSIDRGEDVPFEQEEVVPETVEQVIEAPVLQDDEIAEAMDKIKSGQEKESGGLSTLALILIIAGAIFLFIIIIVVVIIVLVVKKKKPPTSGASASRSATPPPPPAAPETPKVQEKTAEPESPSQETKQDVKTKFCSNCGANVEEGQTFCANCGNKLN